MRWGGGKAALHAIHFFQWLKCRSKFLINLGFFFASVLGSDFIKTSTGKETVNATFPVAIVMLRAIRDFFWKTGKKVCYLLPANLPSK